MAGYTDHQEEEKILNAGNLANVQENDNLKVTRGEDRQVCDKSDKNNSNNIEDELVKGRKLRRMCDESGETEQKFTVQQSQITPDTGESSGQDKHGPHESGQSLGNEKDRRNKAAADEGKDICTVTESGNTSENKCKQLARQKSPITKKATESERERHCPTESGQKAGNEDLHQNEATTEQEKDTFTLTKPENASKSIYKKLGGQQNQINPEMAGLSKQEEHGTVEIEQMAKNEEGGQNEAAAEERKDTYTVTEPGNTRKNNHHQLTRQQSKIPSATAKSEKEKHCPVECGQAVRNEEGCQKGTTSEQGIDKSTVTEPENTSNVKCQQLGTQQTQIRPDTVELPEQEKYHPVKSKKVAGNEEGGQNKVTIEEGNDTSIVTELGNTSKNKCKQLESPATAPAETELEKYHPVEYEQMAGNENDGQNIAAAEEGKDTCTVTKQGNTRKNKFEQLGRQKSQIAVETAESSKHGKHGPGKSGPTEDGQNEATAEGGIDTSTVTKPGNTSDDKRKQLARQLSQTVETVESPMHAERVESGQTVENEEETKNKASGEVGKDTCTVTEPENASKKAHKNLLTVESAIKPPNTLPQAPPEPMMVYFYLFIPGDGNIHEATIHFWPKANQPTSLYQVEELKNLWYCKVTFNSDPIKFHLTYKYTIKISNKTSPATASICSERKKRNVRQHVLFDTFKFPDKRYVEGETIPESVIWYLQRFIKFVTDVTISELLIYIEGFNSHEFSFRSLSTNYVEELSCWILREASHSSCTDIQQLYLCMILSRVCENSTLSLRLNGKKTVCDRFLKCFATCVQFNVLSSSHHSEYLKRLERFAIILVENSSSPGWLTLAARFYPYLGIKFLLDREANAIPDYKYTNEEYQKLVAALFSYITVENQDEHKKMLLLVLKSAPSLLIALDIFERPELSNFFGGKDEKVEFFVSYYQEAQKTNKGKSLQERLTEFHQMPWEILSKIQEMLYPVFIEYASSDDEVDKDVISQLLIFSAKGLGIDCQFITILEELSTSTSIPRQQLLLEILNNTAFKDCWHKIPLKTKVGICKSWIISRVISMGEGNSDSKTKVEQVYNSMNEIMNCHLNHPIDKDLVPNVFAYLSKECFEDKDATGALAAFEKLEDSLTSVRQCYISHIRGILTPGLIKSSTEILEKYTNSSLGQELLLCVLEIIDEPDISEDMNKDENCFTKVLDWCDVWRIVHKLVLPEKDKSFKKYQAGIKVCEKLSRRIEKGNISLDFLEVLDGKKLEVSKLCVVSKTESRQPPGDRISEFTNIVDNCRKDIQLLESAINHCRNYFVFEIETIIEAFNNLKATWRSRRVCELQDPDLFFGTLQELLSPAKALQPLVNSLSFRTVAKNGWNNSGSSADEAECEATKVNIISLLTFLTTTAKKIFQEQWRPVLDDPDSVIIDTMDILLDSIKSDNALDEELNLLEDYFHKEFSSDAKSYLKDYVKCPNVLKRVQYVSNIIKNFRLENSSKDTMSVLLQFQTTLENRKTLTLAKFHKQMETLEQTIPCFSGENLDCVIEELSKSRALLNFIEKIIDEDIRFLIDAVDEQSDQLVAESSVSDLIEVHSFLAPLIKEKKKVKLNVQDFLKMLNSSSRGREDITVKIRQCNTNIYSLRGLYTSITNRGETTKDIIRNCLKKGKYSLRQAGGICETKLTFMVCENGVPKICTYFLSDLHDLRSRARLIVTSQKNAFKVPVSRSNENGEDFDKFINQVNLVTEISTLALKLQSSGYVKYREFWMGMGKKNIDLERNRKSLQDDYENWENQLRKAREKFYFLNYYRSDQLCTLYDFLAGSRDNYKEVLSLIHFLDKTVTLQQLEEYRDSLMKLPQLEMKDNPKLLLKTLGEMLKVLKNISSNFQREIRKTHCSGQSPTRTKLDATVTPGEIFIASMEPKSTSTPNVILELYKNTSNAFPEPYQMVFCSSQTTWEELHLLLQRSFAHSENLNHKSLFCIANVELLPNELQFRLVDVIKEKQSHYQNANYHLALICRGGAHHHIAEQFSRYTHHIAGMSDLALADLLKSSWPDVRTITSTLPGLGKTEQIKHEVLEKCMNITTFSIVGPFEPYKLIQRLKKLKLKNFHCLHLDIGEVSDPSLLDMFLFQLIVTGMVSVANHFYHLPTKHIYIEIANTLNDRLVKSLIVSKCFTSIHLKWQDYNNLIVSNEITSNVQVVCQYLDIVDRSDLESHEVHFSGPKKSEPLPAVRCKELLAKFFQSDDDDDGSNITYTILHTFLGVFANQLLQFSKSTFFKIANLRSMLDKDAQGVRSNLFHSLNEVSKEFAFRAIGTPRSSSTRSSGKAVNSTTKSAEDMVDRVEGMIRWESRNHLVVVFHGLYSQTITAMYREKISVPDNIKKLLTSQGLREYKELEDFHTLSQVQLQKELEKIACTEPVKRNNLFSRYALTTDNVLKMVLIILRIRVNIPVIIMGETGCGKTSLIRYLANTCGVQFYTFNVHAGISEEEIIEFIEKKESHARKTKENMWIFLDEINTCDHLGLISDIMCHHSLLGQPLSKNLVFLAACNPYRLRKEKIQRAGLEHKNIANEYSKLVYRVHPLPEAMIDYVWDYGCLDRRDERDYIKRMVGGLPVKYKDMLVEVLAASQEFIRNAEKNPFCVSLRDVHRCIHLISWFEKMANKREKVNSSIVKSKYPEHLYSQCDEKPMFESIVLALAHCYLSRLPTAELRKNYREKIMDLCNRNGTIMTIRKNVDTFAAIVRKEEEDYLDRMELPPGIAKNAALRENVFVMLVCILNRIPIFVVGKPGCSKSLSIQLIRSNLRGRDSQDPLFKQLPKIYVVSYQGSESSTSEGIIKVFEKARKYKSHSKEILPVVLLDEVGLAENSKYNPLKVLHNLLEPSPESADAFEQGEIKLPDVAVVGISNWSLDAAKMNRAIHLSRPEPTKEDLFDTGHSLYYADGKNNSQYLGKKELRCLAEAYFEYQAQQTHANFHGLRDYYSLIKSLTGCRNFQEVNTSLQRNFGGLPGELTNIQKIFLDKIKKLMISSEDIISVTKLIQANLADPHARHLMLITNGDSAIGILNQTLKKLGKEVITIYGSRFEEDLSEEYNYRILSSIILCMEQDCILILRDLERIYGSLYDMLNQNYAVVGSKKHCRVALGPYSNPMCHVNDGFRCIVLIDHQKVDYSDPPFLNRFEKQVLRFSDVLTDDQRNVITKLHRWVQGMSTAEGLESHFNETDMFIGFHEDTLPSLVLSHSQDTNISQEKLLKKCKDELMWIASPDAVLRTQKCIHLKEDPQEVLKLSDEYFEKPLHQGFAAFMTHVVNNHQETCFFASDEIGSKTVVMTFSNIHTDIHQCLDSNFRCQVERLSAYKSEKQLAERIDEFWQTPQEDLLVLQCKPELDGAHLLLARSIIEEKRNNYKRHLTNMNSKLCKHVCIVVHVQRGEATNGVPWQFTFRCGWTQVFLDMLEAPPVLLTKIRGESIKTLLTSEMRGESMKTLPFAPIRSIQFIAQNHLLWCFTCIKYTRNQRALDRVLHIVKNLFSSEAVSEVIKGLILQSIELDALEHNQETSFKETWQIKVACDRQLLVNSSTLYCAMERFISRLVRNALAKIVFFLENENTWPPHLADESDEIFVPELENLWRIFIMDTDIFKISEIDQPRGTECYVLEGTSLDLCLPFSQRVIKKLDGFKELFLDHYATLTKNQDNLDEKRQMKETVWQQLLEKFTGNFVCELSCYSSDYSKLYMEDVFDIATSDLNQLLNRNDRVFIAKALFVSEVKQYLPAKDMPEFCTLLHTFVWLHSELVLDILKMVRFCRSFIDMDFLPSATNKMFSSLEDFMLIKRNETKLPQEESSEVDNNGSKHAKKPSGKANESTHGRSLSLEAERKVNETEQSIKDIGNVMVELETSTTLSNPLEVQRHRNSKIFADNLITSYCEKMLPSQEIVKRNGGIKLWIQNASLLLSLATKISKNLPAFHCLQLCVDFSRIMFTPDTPLTDLVWLFCLSEISKTFAPKYLDHQESFQTIIEKIIKPLDKEMKNDMEKQEALQRFSALFYGRCIDSNIDYSSTHLIVEQILSLERPELVMIMSPVILQLLEVKGVSPEKFEDLITNKSAMQYCPCLQNIDQLFKDRFSKGLIHHDSYPAVMICGLIERLLNFNDRYEIDNIDRSDCKVLVLAKHANKLISQKGKDRCGLRVLSAVAFLRGFVAMLAKFVAENDNVVIENSIVIMPGVISLLKDSKSSLLTFFLKQIYEPTMKTIILMLDNSSDVIRGDKPLETNDCSTPTMRREAMLTQRVKEVLLNSRKTFKNVEEMMNLQLPEDCQETTLECRILELDNYPENPKEQNEQLKRLFRVKKHPCLQDFRSAFQYSPKDVQEKHSFLTLFFARFDQLSIIGNLFHLLKWSRLLSSELNRLISRDDVRTKSINDFFERHLSGLNRNQKETEILKNVFTKFKEAWEKMRSLVNQKLMGKKEKMPALKEDMCVAYCLTESDCGIYLQTAIKILVSHQNSIIDAITSLLSDRKHPHALSFLQHDDDSGVLSASLQEVKEKEIISFQWSNDLFKYARNSLEYGKGRELTYDFERIEIELATEITFGKCYLTGTLSKFMFANELFHSCGPLLTEVRSLVKQSPSLPQKLLKGLSLLKQGRIEHAPDLLLQVAVLIYLLKRQVDSFSVDMSLEEFAKNCSAMLPSPFPVNLLPEPRSSIRIAHITALYEALEDVLADGAIEGLDTKFREELPDHMKESIRAMGKIDQFKPHNLLKALRRFVFRCLSSETKRYWPKKDKSLNFCLNEPSLWFPLDQPNVEEISEDITLKYTYSMMKYLKEISHVHKKKIEN